MAATHLGAVEYYGYYYNSNRPSAFLNSIFMSTVNTAAKTLVAVASSTKAEHLERWRPADHVRFMLMLMTWFSVWVLRILMDHFPSSLVGPSSPVQPHYFLPSSVGLFDLPPLPSSAFTPSSSLDLVLNQGSDRPSAQALGRALAHIFALLNEIPATSRKYQFAVAMADKIVDENARSGNVELFQINRVALSLAFARTSGLLYRSLKSSSQAYLDDSGTWTSRVLRALPLGSYVAPYLKGFGVCIGTICSTIMVGASAGDKHHHQRRQWGAAGGGEDSSSVDVVAEKHAQELLWITNKLRICGAADEAVLQWSLASAVASLSLTANPRVQGSIVKISSILFGEVTRGGNIEIPSQVKFRLLVLWLPLLCYADNGLAYPVLTGYEKAETERTIDQVISTLPPMDQEVVLTNWLQDFSVSPSDWPNLQISYDRWCQSTRKLIA